MPFLSSLDTRSSKFQPGASASKLSGSILERFGGGIPATPSTAAATSRKSVFERPSAYKPATNASSTSQTPFGGGGGARFRSSTLDRSSNLASERAMPTNSNIYGGSSTVGRKTSFSSSLHQPFGNPSVTAPSPTTVPGIRSRRDSFSDLNPTSSYAVNGALNGGLDDLSAGTTTSKYKAASRSNSRSLFDPSIVNGIANGERENKYEAYSRKISETLARHGKNQEEEETNKAVNGTNNDDYLKIVEDGDYGSSSNNHQWRKKMEEEVSKEKREFALRQAVTVVSRSTSPQPHFDQSRRTRVSRSTEPQELGTFKDQNNRSGRKIRRAPTLIERGVQTDETEDFPQLTCTERKVRPSASFDYYNRVKQSLKEMPSEVMARLLGTKDEEEAAKKLEANDEPVDEIFNMTGKLAAMTQLLPGSIPLTKPKQVPNGRPPPSPSVDDDSSEYEYETEEEDDDDDDVEEDSSSRRALEESYEIKAENILENNSDLDYIDEDEEELMGRRKIRRNRTKTFISGTVDIDELLAKDEKDPNNLVVFGQSPQSPQVIKKAFAKSDDKESTPKVMNGQEEKPWWLNAQSSDADKNVDEDETAADEQWDEEEEETGAGEEEYEWEYYEEEEEKAGTVVGAGDVEEGELDEEEVGEEEQEPEEEEQVHSKRSDIDVREPWIIQGLGNFLPKVPFRKTQFHESEEEEEEEDEKEEEEEVENDKKDQGYKEWLEENAVILHTKIDDLLSSDEEEKDKKHEEEDAKEEVNEMTESAEKIEAEKQSQEQKERAVKAQKLVDKLGRSEGTTLKRILFSLKSIFQTDRNLVYEFVRAGGISKLVEFGEATLDESGNENNQLQNLILRALGQVMLYVDGMNGVMAEPAAVRFLYKLVASPNPLVCKTAVKLLLVFVEYTESNSSVLLQAVTSVDNESEITPWTNIIEAIKKDDANEISVFALTLVNKSLYGIPDQDNFYEHTDYLEELGMEALCEKLTSSQDEALLQQVQLYTVALKQEDGEALNEDDISHLDEDATEGGLRTELRKKKEGGMVKKSLRLKAKKIRECEDVNPADIEGVTMRDLERILGSRGLPVSASGDRLNEIDLEEKEEVNDGGLLEKARQAFLGKLARGELPEKEEQELRERQRLEEEARREGERRWENILANFDRDLIICDMDFTDLQNDDEDEDGTRANGNGSAIPPPPPPPPAGLFDMKFPPPPPPPNLGNGPPPCPAPPPIGDDGRLRLIQKKHKKTVKLFWKEIRTLPPISAPVSQTANKTVWDELDSVEVDTSMIEYLFESRANKDASKSDHLTAGLSSAREIVVLDHKRSNAINIGLTKLPPPRIIKQAVLKMDSSIMSREGVEKLLTTMLPSEEEAARIREAQEAQPGLPLGSAEQFLLTLASVPGLEARLRLWAFKMEFESSEKEVCDPLWDLKTGVDSLRENQTFKSILSVLLTIGNFLNGTPNCRGFQLDYLTKVPEVKDTVHKHSLLYHMTYWVIETRQNHSDLYSEIGPITRASRTDFDEVEKTLMRMESECKLAWDYLKIVSNEESNTELEAATKTKMMEFLHEAAERIIIMNTVYKKVLRRYKRFLSWLGLPPHLHSEYKAHHTCRLISEFALEFRTTRERVIVTIEKKKAAREKKKREKAEADALAQARAQLRNASRPHHRDHQQEPDPTRHHSNRRSSTRRHHREIAEDPQLRALLGGEVEDLEVTENGTLRRKKRHHHRRHRDSRVVEGEVVENGHHQHQNGMDLQAELEERRERRERKSSRRHRSSLLDSAPMPLTEETLLSLAAGSEMERGLLETLMAAPDQNTLKRNKERRKSVKDRRRSGQPQQEIKRSRTRENNAVLELLEAEEQAAAAAQAFYQQQEQYQ